jgi:hypothetical protein
MSAARQNVCVRLGATRRAVSHFKLQDLPLSPANDPHNSSVRIIRNGLAVQCFNILEDFAKARIAEILNDISASRVRFQHLPQALQRASTIDSVSAIAFQVKLREKTDQISFVQQYTTSVASTSAAIVQLSDISFFHTSSNISKDQFCSSLSAFSIDRPWDQISGLCSRLGLSGLPSNTIFTSLAQRRHAAAHNASVAVSETDLLQSLTDAYGLAVSFDILLSKAAQKIIALTATPPSTFNSIANHANIPLRFIKATRRGFSETKEGTTRNIRTNTTPEPLIASASIRARKENGALIVYDSVGSVVEWVL